MTNAQHFQVSGFLTSAFLVFLILFVLFRAPKNKLKSLFIWYTIAVAWWSFFVSLMTLVKDERLSYILCQAVHSAAIFIPCFFLHLVLNFVEKNDFKHKCARVSAYSVSAIFWMLDVFFPRSFIALPVPKLGFSYFTEPGPFYPYWMVCFFAIVIYGHIVLLQSALQAKGEVQKQRLFFFIGNAAGYLGGSASFPPVYNFTLFPYPYGNYGIVLFSAVTAYSIIKYRFMDVRFILKKTLVFAALSFIFLGLFISSAFIAATFLPAGSNESMRLFLFAMVGMIIALAIKPLDRILVNVTDRYLFQKKFNYQELLKDASRGIALIQSLDHLAKLIVTFLTMRARIKNVALYIRSDDENLFFLKAARGFEHTHAMQKFSSNHPLILKLNTHQQPLRLDDLINSPVKNDEQTKTVIEVMRNIEAELVIPSFLGIQSTGVPSVSKDRGLLRSILILGKKKSDETYTDEDMNVFFTIAQESAIAIENARLYDEAVKRAKELEKINQELNAASSRLMHALSETEEANKRLKDTQSQLVHEQKMATMGRLAASVGHEVNNPLTVLSMNVSRVLLRLRKEPDLKVTEILSVFDKMEQNIQRIKAVVNTLTGLLKKSEKGRFEALSVKILIEETLPLVQFQTYLDNLTGTEVEFDIPGDIALVKGDLERLQEVFLNLFINAYQAMVNSRERRIRITARNNYTTKMVCIDFADTGEGIPDEIIKKLFHFRFTTKTEGKGSGIGLYMCRYILELHGGDISVKSKPGEGTTFTVKLPIYEDRSLMNAQDGSTSSAAG